MIVTLGRQCGCAGDEVVESGRGAFHEKRL